jgi:hypothetical protein
MLCVAYLKSREERIAFKLLRRYQFEAKVKLADELAKHYEEGNAIMVASTKRFRTC